MVLNWLRRLARKRPQTVRGGRRSGRPRLLQLKLLEDRLVPAAFVVDTANYAAGNDGNPDTILVRHTGAPVQVLVNGSLVLSELVFNVSSLTIQGSGDQDFVTFEGDPVVPVTIHAGGGTDTVQGPNVSNNWRITGGGSGTLLYGGVTFDSVTNLSGGTGADSFVVLNGGSIIGLLEGGPGADSLTYSGYTTPVTINLQNDTATATGAFHGIERVGGGNTASDTLVGRDVINAWHVTNTNGGDVVNADGTVVFSSFENLKGGSQNDHFDLSNGQGITGTLQDGGGGVALDYRAYTSPVVVNLKTGTATGTGGLASSTRVYEVTGGSAVDTLVGVASPALNIWSITGTNIGAFIGSYGFVDFIAVENLTGDSGFDRFVVGNGAGVTGTVSGLGGTDELNYSAATGPVTVNVSKLASIESLVGGSAADTLVGDLSYANTWTVTGSDAGTFNCLFWYGPLSFTSFENLTGGAAGDTFAFSNGAGVTGTVNGMGGTDTLNFSACTSPVTVNLASFPDFEQAIGGSGSDTLVGPSGTTWNLTGANAGSLTNGFYGTLDYSSIENLTAGPSFFGGDRFVFGPSGSVSGALTGGSDFDTLDYSAAATGVIVNLTTGVATGAAGGVSGIENVTGSPFGDRLTGNAADNLLRGGAGNDRLIGLDGADVLLGGDHIDALDGGAGRDLLIGGLGSDDLTGGSDQDILIGSSTTNDTFDFALRRLADDWKQPALDYATRIDNLRNVGVPYWGYKLNAANVIDDSTADTLTGGAADLDWFWSQADTITDLNRPGPEQVN